MYWIIKKLGAHVSKCTNDKIKGKKDIRRTIARWIEIF
jgi:hypothetical protein